MNTGRFGPVYKELLKRANLSYEDAAKLYDPDSPTWQALDIRRITNSSAEDGADYVMVETNCNVREAIPRLLHLAYRSLMHDTKNVCSAVGQSQSTIAIVGGWANNEALKGMLRGYDTRAPETKVVIPPHAANATEAGLAAEMLRRISLLEGNPMSLEQCLEALPTFAAA